MFHVGYLISQIHLCLIIMCFIIAFTYSCIDVLIYLAAQLQECLIHWLTLLTYYIRYIMFLYFLRMRHHLKSVRVFVSQISWLWKEPVQVLWKGMIVRAGIRGGNNGNDYNYLFVQMN